MLRGVWSSPLLNRQIDRMTSVGITPLAAEGKHVRYHAHLDVFYNGKRVTVPADIASDCNCRAEAPTDLCPNGAR